MVARQLGRKLSVRFDIESFCVYGWPAVIRNEPLDHHGKPHPNLYYLTCPWLRRRIARLEDRSFIDELQKKIAVSTALYDDLRQWQARHAEEYVWAMQNGGYGVPQREMLIAGARDPGLIKCLHSHMAYFLVNPEYHVGREISLAVGEPWCPDDRCAKWMDELERRKQE